MTSKSSKKTDSLISDLFSTDEAVVLKALNKVPEQGNSKFIIPMLKTFKVWESNPEILGKIESILKQLKSESAIPELIAALDDPDFENERALIISSFWNSGLFPVDDVDVLVRQAIKGDYMVTLEAITVIENIESELNQDMIQESIFDIDEALEMDEGDHLPLLEELKKGLDPTIQHMRNLIMLTSLVFLISSCGDQNEEVKKVYDDWKIEFSHLKKTEDNCSDECTQIEMSIPELKGGGTNARSSINEYIDGSYRKAIKTRLPEPNATSPFEDLASSFIEGYELFMLEFPDSDQKWFLELKGDSSILTDDYFTFVLNEADYMGGAHSNAFTTIQTFDLDSGKPLNVFSVYDSLSTLSLAEASFREYHEMPDSTSLNDFGMMFENGTFSLPENYGLTPSGLLLYYNSYEVASYATGTTKLILPYTELKEINSGKSDI